MKYYIVNEVKIMSDPKQKADENSGLKKKDDRVKIKYDVITPDDREPQPKAYDEIEY